MSPAGKSSLVVDFAHRHYGGFKKNYANQGLKDEVNKSCIQITITKIVKELHSPLREGQAVGYYRTSVRIALFW